MTRSSALLLQGIIVLLAVCALAFLLCEPHYEGRNAHSTPFQVYFNDPFLIYVYVGSISFFVALYRAFGLVGHLRQSRAWSQASVDAARTIKQCGMLLIGFVAGGVMFILLSGDAEDRPAGLVMGLLCAIAASSIAFAGASVERSLQRALQYRRMECAQH
jgi:hypothetical protein